MTKFTTDLFLRDVSGHQLTIRRDDGLYRHIRVGKPGRVDQHFEVITWPGYLAYVGDMGAYTFARLPDMFQFFRGTPDRLYRFDVAYWAEKCEAHCRDGIREFSAETFCAQVLDYVEQDLDGEDEWTPERRADLLEALKDQVFSEAEAYDESGPAFAALHRFEHDGFTFEDYERTGEVFSFRFLWCLHALRFAISLYDQAKEPAHA